MHDDAPPPSVSWDLLLTEGAETLRVGRGSGRENPTREAQLLLRAATGRTVEAFLRERSRAASPAEAARYREWIAARAAGVPLQHLTGRADFHEIELRCEPGVFIPRPETELLVELALQEMQQIAKSAGASFGGAGGSALPAAHASARSLVVVDVCTGTGAIAVAVASASRRADLPARIYAGDVNEAAVLLAWRNAEACGVGELLDVRTSDLLVGFADLAGRVDLLLSNPPYIDPACAETLPVEVRFGDPPLALFDPEGGIGFHRRLAREGRIFLREDGVIALEIGDDQGEAAARLLVEEGYDEVRILPDLAGRDRIARGRWRSSTRSS